MGDFSGPGVDYENIVKVLLYGRVGEGRPGYLSKHTRRHYELLSGTSTALIDSHLSMKGFQLKTFDQRLGTFDLNLIIIVHYLIPLYRYLEENIPETKLVTINYLSYYLDMRSRKL